MNKQTPSEVINRALANNKAKKAQEQQAMIDLMHLGKDLGLDDQDVLTRMKRVAKSKGMDFPFEKVPERRKPVNIPHTFKNIALYAEAYAGLFDIKLGGSTVNERDQRALVGVPTIIKGRNKSLKSLINKKLHLLEVCFEEGGHVVQCKTNIPKSQWKHIPNMLLDNEHKMSFPAPMKSTPHETKSTVRYKGTIEVEVAPEDYDTM